MGDGEGRRVEVERAGREGEVRRRGGDGGVQRKLQGGGGGRGLLGGLGGSGGRGEEEQEAEEEAGKSRSYWCVRTRLRALPVDARGTTQHQLSVRAGTDESASEGGDGRRQKSLQISAIVIFSCLIIVKQVKRRNLKSFHPT